MKILVLSDSHGNLTNMELAVERTNPSPVSYTHLTLPTTPYV